MQNLILLYVTNNDLTQQLLDKYYNNQSSTQPENQNISSNVSIKDKIQGLFEKGSLHSSTFQLCTAAIGTGVLSLPYVLAQNGFVIGAFMILIGALSSYLSLKFMSISAKITHSKTYVELARKVIGQKVDILITFLILFGSVGTQTSYQIIILMFLQYFIVSIGISSEIIYSLEMDIYQIIAVYYIYMELIISISVALFIIFPLVSSRHMGAFRYVSILSLVSISYILLVLIYYLPAYIRQNYSYERLNFATLNLQILSSFSITFFAFSCHVEGIAIINELKDSTEQRITKLVKRSVSTNLFFYLTIGMAGYFSTYELTASIVIQRDPLIGQQYDYLLMLGRLMLVIVLCIPPNQNCLQFNQQNQVLLKILIIQEVELYIQNIIENTWQDFSMSFINNNT